ncbi:MAG TPA: hypothetical protein VL485_18250 [Ktedonobacteraceae bacterium]|jgi:hypothetical protein|nr:hypothetical protein [Ktedonobacteraceae bacterium]
MAATPFADLYADLSNDVFREQARLILERGADAYACAIAYAQQGKPDFTLAFLLLSEETSDEEKCALLAQAYEQRAAVTDEKAESFDKQFHRPFPLVKLEAQKDRMAARQIRQGRRVRRESRAVRVQ